jgi:hypothetical protein
MEAISAGAPAVRLDEQGRVVADPGIGPIPLVWLPVDRQVVARTPAGEADLPWLRGTVCVRSPRLDADGRWQLPRSCATRLVTAAIDRYGYVVLWRDMSRLSRCTKACLEAVGTECDCSCLGLHHGESAADGWFEAVGDVVVADLGEKTRAAVVYGPAGTVGGAAVYRGELDGKLYRPDPSRRKGWPKAARFMCAACLTARASVWDHCHVHGFVRAPLCNGCNTRHWSGWGPEHGRAVPSLNVDPSYYRRCPNYAEAECSA